MVHFLMKSNKTVEVSLNYYYDNSQKRRLNFVLLPCFYKLLCDQYLKL